MFLICVTGFKKVEEGRIEIDKVRIFSNYAKTWLLWDIAANTPWNFVKYE